MQLEQLKEKLINAGVVGAGGAGFPTSFKLRDDLDTLLVNAAECEPLIFTDYFLMKNYLDDVIKGATEIMEATGIKRTVFGMKQHTAHKLHLENNQQLAKNIWVKTVPNVYPMGDELILIYEALGKIVPPGSLPMTVGVMVSNVETLYNVSKAVNDIPVTDKFLTIGGKTDKGCVIKVSVGTNVADLFNMVGVTVPDDCVVIDGGPAMGNIIDYKTSVVTKTTKALLILPKNIPAVITKKASINKALKRANSVCCQCQMCTDMCPRALLGYPLRPSKIVRNVASVAEGSPNDYLTAQLCSGCGVCELIACCQGISPKKVFFEIKGILAKNKLSYKHDGSEVKPESERVYRMLPITRFKERIGVMPFDKAPSYTPKSDLTPKKLVLPLKQHVGAPATPVVAVGDTVSAGMVVAKAAAGISANIHTAMAGKITNITERAIEIDCR